MSVSFQPTFGALGDFASLGSILRKVYRTVSDSRHVEQEVRELVEYLNTLRNTLACIRPLLLLTEPHTPSDRPSKILSKPTVAALQKAINDSEREIAKADMATSGLRVGARGELWVEIKCRAQWILFGRGEARKVKDELKRQAEIIGLVLHAQETDTWMRIARSLTREPAANGVQFVDILNHHHCVALPFCHSFEMFEVFLHFIFQVGKRAGATYIRNKQYLLTASNSYSRVLRVTRDNWDRLVGCGTQLQLAILVVCEVAQRDTMMRSCPTCGTVCRKQRQGSKTYICTYCDTTTTIRSFPVVRGSNAGRLTLKQLERNKEKDIIRRYYYEFCIVVPVLGRSGKDAPILVRGLVTMLHSFFTRPRAKSSH